MKCDVIITKKSTDLAADINKWLGDHPKSKIVTMTHVHFGNHLLTTIIYEG